MADPPPLKIADWSSAYANGASPRELLVALQRRLEVESAPGVWISLADRAAVETRAAALEARRARSGDAALRAALPLFGVPFAVKDNINDAGLATSAACPAYRYLPAAHAGAVEKLIAAGAVCVSKTNLDQFAPGPVGTRSPYGRPSTFAPERISGGSSSGSAVAVSRGDVPFVLATDTAGPGRVPAAFNHVVGLKPTPGRVGMRGTVPACRSIDCVSVMALTVADAALVLALIEGPDDADPFSAYAVGPALRRGASRRCAIAGDLPRRRRLRPAYEQAIAHLRRLGHRVVALDFAPLHAVGEQLYGGAWVAGRLAVVEALLERDPEAIDPVVRTVIGAACTMSATDAFRSLYALRAAQRDTRAIWDQVDLLMVPSAAGHPRHAEVDAEPIAVNAQLGAYASFVNLLGWCALAVPAGFTAGKLPFGVTFVAPHADDAALADFGADWQDSLGLPLGATARRAARRADVAPPRVPASAATVRIAVVGAHLSGLPLHPQLLALGARECEPAWTAPCYRLYALPGATPPKPGMLRVTDGGAAIEIEVWSLRSAQVGAFLASIAAPLGLGTIELADGRQVHGFLCEAHALANAVDITEHGGWRAYLASRSSFAGAAAGA